MAFTFKIFGAPNIFDLYQSTENEINYFQLFDNGSREKVKLTIHRMSNGQISYSYLRYNYISGGGRTGAFFGMSVVFDGEYCYDVTNLYKLFDSVYKTIIQNKILITEIKGNPTIQAKYLVRNFSEAENEVKRIENIVSKNILNAFSKDIHPIDSSFKQAKSDIVRKLNVKKANSVFLEALREYLWISISPEYKDVEINLSPGAIADLNKTIKEYNEEYDRITLESIKGEDTKQAVEDLNQSIKHKKESIQSYLNTQPELIEIDKEIIKVQTKLNDLKKALAEKSKTTKDNVFANINTISDTYSTNEKDVFQDSGNKTGNKAESQNIHRNKRKISIGWILVSIGVIVLLFIFYPRGDKDPYKEDCSTPITSDTDSVANTKIAIEDISIEESIDSLKLLAEKEYKKEYNIELDKFKAIRQILEQTEDYNYNSDSIINKYAQKTISYYESQIQKARSQQNKKKYAECILQIDSTNEYALEITNVKSGTIKTDINKHTALNKTPCYVNIQGYTQKKTVDEFLKTIENDLQLGQSVAAYNTLMSYCDKIINDQVGCPVTEDQIKKARNLKNRDRIPEKK